MKQRVLPILLSLALCLTLLPAAAWAAEGGPGLSEQSTSQTPENPSGADQGTSGGSSNPDAPEAKPEEGKIDPEEPEVGNGSEDTPYEIGTVEELLWFAGLVNGTLGDRGDTAEEGAEEWAETAEDGTAEGTAERMEQNRICGKSKLSYFCGL